MRWEEFEALETEREYDGYFYSIKNVVVIVILGSLSDLKSVKKIHEWTITDVPHLSSKIATEEEGQNKKKNKPFTVAIDRKEIHSTRNMTVLLT